MLDTDHLQTELIEQTRELTGLAKELRDALLSHRDQMWCCLPAFDDHESDTDLASTLPSSEAWFKLADTLTDIWMNKETHTHHGVLVTDVPALLDLLATFNAAKVKTAEVAKKLKTDLLNRAESAEDFGFTGDSLKQYALVRDEFLSRGRDRQIHLLLRENHAEQLNFKKALRLIKVTQEAVTRFRYVWSKTNYRKRPISGSDLLMLADHHRHRMNNPLLAEFIEEGLAQHNIVSSTKLYRLSFIRPTLKANYKYAIEDGHEWGHCLASGIVVIPQSSPPTLIWQAEPSEVDVAQARETWQTKSKLDRIVLADQVEVYRELQ